MSLEGSYRARVSVFAVLFLVLIGITAVVAALRQSVSFLVLWGTLNLVFALIGFIVYTERDADLMVPFLLYGWVYIAIAIVNVIFTLFLVFNCLIAGQSCPGVDVGFGLVIDFAILLISLVFGSLIQDALLKLRDVKIKRI